MLEKQKKVPKWSHPIVHKTNKRMDKFYNYHKDHGLNTEGCWQLKYLIADMINEGKLKEYLLTPTTSQQSETPRARKQDDEVEDRDRNLQP